MTNAPKGGFSQAPSALGGVTPPLNATQSRQMTLNPGQPPPGVPSSPHQFSVGQSASRGPYGSGQGIPGGGAFASIPAYKHPDATGQIPTSWNIPKQPHMTNQQAQQSIGANPNSTAATSGLNGQPASGFYAGLQDILSGLPGNGAGAPNPGSGTQFGTYRSSHTGDQNPGMALAQEANEKAGHNDGWIEAFNNPEPEYVPGSSGTITNSDGSAGHGFVINPDGTMALQGAGGYDPGPDGVLTREEMIAQNPNLFG